MDFYGFEGKTRQEVIDAAINKANPVPKKKKKKTKTELRQEAIERNAKQMMERNK